MIERLMTDRRKPVVTALAGLLGLMMVLWFVRGPRLDWPNVELFVISLLLIPLAALSVYGLLFLGVRANQVSGRALRVACGSLFVAGAVFLAGSALFAVRQFATHRVLPPPNLIAFGVALGAMKACGLRAIGPRP
jgi:hypothetical protein